MSFLSSLAKPFKKVLDFGKDLVGNVVESVVGDPLGAIGTVGKVVGGIMGNNSQSSANEANQALAQQQFQFQKDYIQNQMQWRMADAQKAGIHPLAALGIQSPGFSPVSSSSSGLDYSWLGDLGQSANYSATKAKTTPEQQKMIDLQLQNMQLQNDLLQAQVDNMKVDALASSIASNQAFDSPPSPKVNLQEPTGLPQRSDYDAFSVRHIRDNDYDINYTADYQQELGDELGQAYNMLRKASRENGSIWTDPKTGVAYVFNRNSGFWNRFDALSVEEAERLLGKPSHSSSGVRPVPSSHFVRNRHRYRY